MNDRQKIATVSSSRRAGVQYMVNLSARTCSCGKWATFRFPCTHVVKVVDVMSLSIADYLHGEHSTAFPLRFHRRLATLSSGHGCHCTFNRRGVVVHVKSHRGRHTRSLEAAVQRRHDGADRHER